MGRKGTHSPGHAENGLATASQRLAPTSTFEAWANDAFRRTFEGGQVVISSGVCALPRAIGAMVIQGVTSYSDFSPGTDPAGEHRGGRFVVAGYRVCWKIESTEFAAAPSASGGLANMNRVLTIMLADEC